MESSSETSPFAIVNSNQQRNNDRCRYSNTINNSSTKRSGILRYKTHEESLQAQRQTIPVANADASAVSPIESTVALSAAAATEAVTAAAATEKVAIRRNSNVDVKTPADVQQVELAAILQEEIPLSRSGEQGQKQKQGQQQCDTGETSETSSLSNTNGSIVQFDRVTIREYMVTIGDNPSCTSGVPISLDWVYNPDHEETSVNNYETFRAEYRRFTHEMMIPAHVRHDMLRNEWDVSMTDIMKVSKQIGVVKTQRFKTANQHKRRVRAEEFLETILDSIKKLNCFR
jgi:hypothetical protein